MKCDKCGAEMSEWEKFCPGCGAKTEFADKEFGKIKVDRPGSALAFAIPFSVFIDGKSKGSISNGSTLTFDVPFGTHVVAFNSAKDKENREITLSESKKEITITIKPKMGLLVGKAKIQSVE